VAPTDSTALITGDRGERFSLTKLVNFREAQVGLLRILQEFERVGGTQSIQADVRVIATTDRDLRAEIVNGKFRSDLFSRLNVFPIDLPSLRERKDDIRILLEHFVKPYASRTGKNVPSN
jgi:DNA-binding NtrC family response regulator